MNKRLNDGVPSIEDYNKVIASNTFKDMEVFSDQFILDNKPALGKYIKRWVGDPLHQWSRQWEYPYVNDRVQQLASSGLPISVLDAGSGITFFPYFLNAKVDNLNMHCCDYDPILIDIYKKTNVNQKNKVNFSKCDLKKLPYDTDSFDIVYCISVLEHTDDYETIIEEFYRVLRPGGMLVVTFDISLDGTRDIDLDKSKILLNLLTKRFDKDNDIALDLSAQTSSPEVFTTLSANELNPDLLPWKAPSFLYRTKSFITKGTFGSWPPPMTIYCVSLTKSKPST